jgi:glutathione S-transferase
MITLYHCMNARSFRPLWTLEEIGLPYQLVVLPFPPRVLRRDYLKINSLGTVPTLIDGDTCMTESAAICQYLAARYDGQGLNVPPEASEYGAFLNFLHFGEATLTFPQTLVLRYRLLEPPERQQPQVAEDYRRWFLGRLRRISEVLATQPYVCGNRFTAADVSVGYALLLAEQLGLQADFPERVMPYWNGLKERAGYQRAVASQRRAAQSQGVSAASPIAS